jgi:hypothetical protein
MAWELLLFVAIWKPLQGGAGLYSKDVSMALRTFTETGLTTKLDLAICLVNFGLGWTRFIVSQPSDRMY